MSLPFTVEQFLDTFRRYNEGVWPAQWVLTLLAFAAVAATFGRGRAGSRVASVLVGAFWIWTASTYHLTYFRVINPAALMFALLFLLEGVLLFWFGVLQASLRFEPRANPATVVGLSLVAYALVVYPLIGYALGHRYPAAPTFGVPCPTTIFTFGVLLLAPPPRSRALIIVPAAWALLGISAAIQLGMWEDVGLVVAAILAVAFVLLQRKERRSRTPIHPTAAPA